MKTRRLTRLLKRYGRQTLIAAASGETDSVQAVISPLRYKNRMYTGGEYSPAGYLDGGHYVFVSAYTPIKAAHGDRICASGMCYVVRRWDVLYLGERPVLIWAVLSNAQEVT